jgi:hypothetical protein
VRDKYQNGVAEWQPNHGDDDRFIANNGKAKQKFNGNTQVHYSFYTHDAPASES